MRNTVKRHCGALQGHPVGLLARQVEREVSANARAGAYVCHVEKLRVHFHGLDGSQGPIKDDGMQ